ncbi:hypothetical protein cand_001600 [Cryptosporidium andersoni]|uniref:Uncharacterized protein n=1 Tax=Cryptosporidium andersoni TaxID=117008 RepID=A0A1J4MUD3_9CRYT|nr:hypothetical protein cand_001600 [Cryptosporidium andersoni]
MSLKKKDEKLIIGIKSVIEVLVFISLITSLLYNNWFNGNEPGIKVIGSLSNICFISNSIENLENKENILNNFQLIKHSSLLKYIIPIIKKNLSQKYKGYKDSLIYEEFNNFTNYSIYCCIEYKYDKELFDNILIFGFSINCSIYLSLLITIISLITNIWLIKKKQWNFNEVFIPIIDFLNFLISFFTILKISHIISPIIMLLINNGFSVHLSISFFIYCIVLGILFAIFSISLGTFQYRFEKEKRNEDIKNQIERLEVADTLLKIISH